MTNKTGISLFNMGTSSSGKPPMQLSVSYNMKTANQQLNFISNPKTDSHNPALGEVTLREGTSPLVITSKSVLSTAATSLDVTLSKSPYSIWLPANEAGVFKDRISLKDYMKTVQKTGRKINFLEIVTKLNDDIQTNTVDNLLSYTISHPENTIEDVLTLNDLENDANHIGHVCHDILQIKLQNGVKLDDLSPIDVLDEHTSGLYEVLNQYNNDFNLMMGGGMGIGANGYNVDGWAGVKTFVSIEPYLDRTTNEMKVEIFTFMSI